MGRRVAVVALVPTVIVALGPDGSPRSIGLSVVALALLAIPPQPSTRTAIRHRHSIRRALWGLLVASTHARLPRAAHAVERGTRR